MYIDIKYSFWMFLLIVCRICSTCHFSYRFLLKSFNRTPRLYSSYQESCLNTRCIHWKNSIFVVLFFKGFNVCLIIIIVLPISAAIIAEVSFLWSTAWLNKSWVAHAGLKTGGRSSRYADYIFTCTKSEHVWILY